MALTEFELIRRYFTHRARGAVLGVGDDAAIVRARPGHELVVTADMLVEGRHFAAGADPEKLGHKALAVNLSDIAAMGARPRWATLALALPRADAHWLAAFSRGFMRLARRHGVDLVGGDTTRGPLNICVQVVGEVPRGRALRRDGARPGDDVWVSGTLGDAALALAAGRLRLPPGERRALQARLDLPTPRIDLGLALRGLARSAIDVSDGLVADLGHICERSGVSAVVELESIPISAVLRSQVDRVIGHLRLLQSSLRGPGLEQAAPPLAALLAGGDDYELCFTAGRAQREAIARLARRLGLKLSRIGTITRPRRGTAPVTVLDAGGRPLAVRQTGYKHF